MKNKGFAVTGMLFIILLIFLAMYISLLTLFANRRQIYETIKDDIINDENVVGRKYFLSTANIGDYVSYPVNYTNCVVEANSDNTGWRIMSINDNVVTLVSSGTPDCFNPSTFDDNGVISKQLISNELAKYLNTDYADSVRNFNGADFLAITGVNYSLCYNVTSSECGSDNSLISLSNSYWLSENRDSSSLYYWSSTDNKLSSGSDTSYGLRPVIVLKDAILYSSGTGTIDDPYILIKP